MAAQPEKEKGMIPTRRSLLWGGAASMLALTSSKAFGHELKDGWQYVGANKFAYSATVAFARLPRALELLQFPARLDQVQAVIKQYPSGMRQGTLKNGDPDLIGMVSGGGIVDFNVHLNFKPLAGGVQPPIINTMEWDIGGYTLILPEICFNWCYRLKAAFAPPPPVQHQCECECERLHYILPARTTSLFIELVGPYSLDSSTCFRPEQWGDNGCFLNTCFEHEENFMRQYEPNVIASWRKFGRVSIPDSPSETSGILYLPKDVINGFGFTMCVRTADGEQLYFTYGAWQKPFTNERDSRAARFQPVPAH